TSACHAHACAIQSCLQKNTFQQDKCEGLIDALYRCCARFYRSHGTDAKQPDACPKPAELKKKLEKR
ncbi:DUF1903-domain-containing protein, partial [Tilletiaria anomala UBC 951]